MIEPDATSPDPAAWWRDAVIYEIYVRSFADGDGDGLGDLCGIRGRLPYLRDLGVDAVWLTPFYPSPQADGGYDVAVYRDVDPRFGTLADFDGLVADAHALGLRTIIDIVPNHTSSGHEWFRAALAAPPGSPERARYVFRDGRGVDGAVAPNDWRSVFGGAAWTRVIEADGRPGQWYLHLFAPEQPDLDWTNEEVCAEFESVLRFWLDRGVDGFRIDVAHGLMKELDLPDLAGRFPSNGPAAAGHPHWDRDEVHEIFRRWRRVADAYPPRGSRVFVAEAWVDEPERLARYVRPDELHTAFNFDFLLAAWDATALRTAIDDSIAALHAAGAPATWVLSNHDTVRHVTRYGGGAVGLARARAAALLMLALPGGAYLYQGEELGLPEVLDLPDELREDPTFARTAGAERGRDGCRVPLPWSGSAPPFGFGPGADAWLPQPPEWVSSTAEHEAGDPTSMLELYRAALRLRREHAALGDGTIAWLDAPTGVLAFARDPGFACVVNLRAAPVALADLAGLADATVLLASTSVPAVASVPSVAPDAAVWLTRRP